MKSIYRVFLSVIVLAAGIMACGLPNSATSSDAVNTAVAGTQQAQALAQATVNADSLTAMPTPGPTAEYVTMTEEQLTALIDQSVNAAIAATEQTTQAVNDTTSDGNITQDEVTYVYSYYYTAADAINEVEQYIDYYYSQYSDLAQQMITELNTINTELNQMNATLDDIASSLDQINSTLSQGLQLAEDSITQLQQAAQGAQEHASNLQNQVQNLQSTLQADQQGRLDQLSQIQPKDIPTDKLSALQAAFQFVDTAKTDLGDNKLSRDELLNLAQLGANAGAGLQKFGGSELGGVSGKFSEITTQLARGQMPQARDNLSSFEVSLGQRPSPGGGAGLPSGGPGLPGGGPGTRRP